MSWNNEEKCPTLKKQAINLNQSAYSPRGNGRPLPLVRRNNIKNLCLNCKLRRCVYDFN